ncbi:MAG: mCpol domain-containing protein, partial [Blastocatellia bacterium]
PNRKRPHVSSTMYLHLDGDDVGSRLELLLLDGRLDKAATLSSKVTRAMQALRVGLEEIDGLEVRLFGGDDLIATCPSGAVTPGKLQELRRAFKRTCGITLSSGAGPSVQEALSNLRRAKLSGKNRSVGKL